MSCVIMVSGGGQGKHVCARAYVFAFAVLKKLSPFLTRMILLHRLELPSTRHRAIMKRSQHWNKEKQTFTRTQNGEACNRQTEASLSKSAELESTELLR